VISYVRDNLAGALEVMFGRHEGLNKLDTSLEGFWRSFAAFVLVLPFAVIALMSQEQLAALGAETGGAAESSFGVELAVLVVDWLAFPLLFALLARPLGLGPRYVPFIVTRNWASVVVGAMMAAVHALFLVGILPGQAAVLILLAFIGMALRFSYVIARIALEVPLRTALPIVVFDFLLSLAIWSAFDPVG
jgi:hypothetical protein